MATKKTQPRSKAEVRLLAELQTELIGSDCRVTVNPTYNIPMNLDWLASYRKDTERQIALIDDAINKLLGSKLYKKNYLPEVSDGFFATTT